jgi:hypothetical protein
MTGFNSKRDAAADKLQKPDALTIAYQSGYYNGKKAALAQPAQEPINLLEARKIAAEYGTPDSQIDSGNLYFALSKCLEHIDAQPMQEPVGTLNISRYKGHLVNHDFDYFGELPDGTYSVYTTPPLPVQPEAKVQNAKDAANEAAAKALYETWHSQPGYLPWQDGGNSLKQGEARKLVRLAAHNIGAKP